MTRKETQLVLSDPTNLDLILMILRRSHSPPNTRRYLVKDLLGLSLGLRRFSDSTSDGTEVSDGGR